jgi:hypothetical protein
MAGLAGIETREPFKAAISRESQQIVNLNQI